MASNSALILGDGKSYRLCSAQEI